ncbi:MAG TPA: 50S ribosomal protein L9 [Phycisphaerae bacterium]|nr:50S ribosomal protein L9 [Phycisphaerae bacterium]
MKVLLRKNVYKLGQIGDVVEVKNGYGRNFLIPQGMAYIPSEANIRAVENEKARYLEELARQRTELETRAKAVNGKEVTITARANSEGVLYGSVGPAQIAAAFSEIDVHINPDEIVMHEPIRKLDRHEVNVRLGQEVKAVVYVWITPLATAGEESAE